MTEIAPLSTDRTDDAPAAGEASDATETPRPRRRSTPPSGLRALGTTTHRPKLEIADTDDAKLVARAMDASRDPTTRLRLTQEEFAARVLDCHPRTLRKYLSGRLPLRPLYRRVLEDVIASAAP